MSYWTLTRHTEHTARKEHTCSGCHHTILPGQTYTRLEGLYDGEWTTWKECGRCVPWHENVNGGYVRPIDVLDELLATADDPEDGLHDAERDGATLTLHGLEVGRYHDTNEAIYQASLVPGVGLTGWVKIAEKTRVQGRGQGWGLGWKELTEVTCE